MKNKKIVIVGAARSGTHFISKLLRENIDNYKYFGEIREVWEMGLNKTSQSDVITRNMYNENGIKIIQKYFQSNIKKDEILIEKTANNCFRLPLVYDVFPDAYFIHIVRDGRDVAVSARKKMQGDIRKISKVGDKKSITLKSRINSLFTVVRNKIKYLSIKNLKRYFLGALSQLGIINNTLWGPRFLGMQEASKIYTPLELSALQWKHSVESIESFFMANQNVKNLEVRFEDLVENPEKEMNRLFEFLELEYVEGNFDFIEKELLSSTQISSKEEKQILEVEATLLKRLGYIE